MNHYSLRFFLSSRLREKRVADPSNPPFVYTYGFQVTYTGGRTSGQLVTTLHCTAAPLFGTHAKFPINPVYLRHRARCYILEFTI